MQKKSETAIHIENPDVYTQKIHSLKKGGLTSLHIVADFDKTLTQAQDSTATWEAFQLNDEYIKERARLVSIYQPIEYDTHLSPEEKQAKMVEWWKLHLSEIIKHGLHEKLIKDAFPNVRIHGRNGLKEICAFTYKHNIPFLIFSAGLGDVILEFFKHHDMLYPNMHIISNFFVFDKGGNPLGFENEIVHSYNKSEVQLKHLPYMKEIKNRPNVLLLGDTVGDASMAQGMLHDTILKVGFLNGRHENLESYKNIFDSIDLNDGDLFFVKEILEYIDKSIK